MAETLETAQTVTYNASEAAPVRKTPVIFSLITSMQRADRAEKNSGKKLTPREWWRLAMALVLDSVHSPVRALHRMSRSSSFELQQTNSTAMQRRRRDWIEERIANEPKQLADRFFKAKHWAVSDASLALEEISRKSHAYRLRYSGGLLLMGATLFISFQVIGLVQGMTPGWSNEAPPGQIWQTLSLIAPIIMLGALRPCDRLAIRIAAALLTTLCIYCAPHRSRAAALHTPQPCPHRSTFA